MDSLLVIQSLKQDEMSLLKQTISYEHKKNIDHLCSWLDCHDESLHIYDCISLGNHVERLSVNIIGVMALAFEDEFYSDYDAWLGYQSYRPGFECDLTSTYKQFCLDKIGFYFIKNEGGLLIGFHKYDQRYRPTFKQWASILKDIIS